MTRGRALIWLGRALAVVGFGLVSATVVLWIVRTPSLTVAEFVRLYGRALGVGFGTQAIGVLVLSIGERVYELDFDSGEEPGRA